MFIFAFIVGEEQDRSHPLIPYPLKFRLRPEAYLKLSPILLHHLIGTLRSHSIRVMSRPRFQHIHINIKGYFLAFSRF